MNVFIENQSGSGSSFEIEVDPWDKVLDIKEKIVKSQRIPVSKQTLFFQGTVLQDDLDVEHYVIDDDSRLQLFISPDHNPNHNVIQTQKSLLPSSNDELLNNQEDLPAEVGRSGKDNQVLRGDESPLPLSIDEFLSNQEDLPVKVGSSDNDNQVLQGYKSPSPSSIDELFRYLEDLPVKVGSIDNDNQVLQGDKSPLPSINEFFDLQDSSLRVESSDNSPEFQNEQAPVPSDSVGDNINDEDLPLTIEHVSNIRSLPITPEEIIKNQDSQMILGSNNNKVFQTQQSPLSDRMKHILNNEYSRLMNSLQTKQSPSLGSNKETINIPEEIINNQDSQMIMGSNNNTVFQTQQSPFPSLQTEQTPYLDSTKETINIPDSHVKKQRKPNPRKLRVMVLPFSGENKADREIPEEGYFFKHKQRVLNDDQSFRSQGVANGDQIEISTKHDTHDSSTEK